MLQAVELVASVPKWADQLIEMRLWTRLAQFALAAGEHEHIERCANSALQYADLYVDKTRSVIWRSYFDESVACFFGLLRLLRILVSKKHENEMSISQFSIKAFFGNRVSMCISMIFIATGQRLSFHKRVCAKIVQREY